MDVLIFVPETEFLAMPWWHSDLMETIHQNIYWDILNGTGLLRQVICEPAWIVVIAESPELNLSITNLKEIGKIFQEPYP